MDLIRLGTHLFGSRAGYRTIARSPDVSDAEDAELAVFGFGQTADDAVLDRLDEEPSAFGRPVTGGRVAITRLFRGEPDESGRATLELRTILVSPADAPRLLRAGLGVVLQHPAIWDRRSFLAGEGRAATPPEGEVRRDEAVEQAFAAWSDGILGASAPESRRIAVLDPEPAGSAAISGLVALVRPSDLLRLRWGVRLLSIGVPVDVCTLATGVRATGRRIARRVRLGSEEAIAERQALADALGTSSDGMLPSLAAVGASRTRPMVEAARPRTRRAPALVAVGILVAAGAGITIAVARCGGTTTSSEDRATGTLVDAAKFADESEVEPDAAEPPEAPPLVEDVAATDGDDPLQTEPASSLVDAPAPGGLQQLGGVAAGTEPPIAPIAPVAADEEVDPVASDETAEPKDSPVSEDASPAATTEEPAAPTVTGEEQADPSPVDPADAIVDPCERCRETSRWIGEQLDLADRAIEEDRWGDAKLALDGVLQQLRSLRLDEIEGEERRVVLQRLRGRGTPRDLDEFESDWSSTRDLLCRLEVWQAWLDRLEEVSSRLAARASESRQSAALLRKDSLWILGSERPTGPALRRALSQLKERLLAEAEALGAPATLRAWLLLERDVGTRVWSDERFRPPFVAPRPPVE